MSFTMSGHDMTTLLEMQQMVGKSADYTISTGFFVRVFIRDARVRYGDLDYLVEPVCGSGTKWVAQYKLTNVRDIPTV